MASSSSTRTMCPRAVVACSSTPPRYERLRPRGGPNYPPPYRRLAHPFGLSPYGGPEMRRARSVTRRSVPAIVGGLVAALVAAIAALAINLGILGAIGPPEGPGRLDAATAPRAISSASPGRLRAAAWTAAGVSLVAPSVALAVAPRPAPASAYQAHRQVIVLHRTIRKIVYPAASAPTTAPPVRYVYVGGGSVSSGSTATTRCSGC